MMLVCSRPQAGLPHVASRSRGMQGTRPLITNHTHIPLTTYRKTGTGSNAERVLEMEKKVRNQRIARFYSNEEWAK